MIPVRRKHGESGSAMVEMALMSPWIFFLFIGIFAFGFYAYAATCVQSAARQAAVRTAQDTVSQTNQIACDAAKAEMNEVPNSSSFSATCTGALSAANPLIVTQTTMCGTTVNLYSVPACTTTGVIGGPRNVSLQTPACADCSVNTAAAASQVNVAYRSIALVPIPGLLTGTFILNRSAQVRIAAQ